MMRQYPSDEALMFSVSQGQLDCLGELFERYHRKLYSFYMRQLNQESELCQDLTQSVFERILKYRHSYREGQPFRAWFYQIARNVQADHFKKNKMPLNPLDDQQSERNLHLSYSLEAEQERGEQWQVVQHALAQLPDDKREILLLSQVEQLEYKEIAQMLNINENAARVKVHRALKSLKDICLKIFTVS